MDSEKALELVKHGATLLFLDVPQHTLIGIDTQMFTVGPNFKGIKMIPPGIHFVFYSASTRDGKEFSPTIGFFIDVAPSQVSGSLIGRPTIHPKAVLDAAPRMLNLRSGRGSKLDGGCLSRGSFTIRLRSPVNQLL